MGTNVIAMNNLGTYRFGNQILLYSFLQVYAQKYGLQVQTDPWVGEHLFDLSPACRISERLPVKREHTPSGDRWAGVPPEGDEFANTVFQGYAQWHTSYYAPYDIMLWNLFRAKSTQWQRLAPLLDNEVTLIGIHIRRGDAGRRTYFLTPVWWYQKWLSEHWDKFENPCLFIATEDKSLLEPFAPYRPITTHDILEAKPMQNCMYLKEDDPSRNALVADFFPDWLMLRHCDVVVMPNSTFSFTAAMMNPGLKECWRARLSTQRFELIYPWDCTPLNFEFVEEYDVPGTEHISKYNAHWAPPPS